MASMSAALAPSTAGPRAPATITGTRPEARARSAGSGPRCAPQRCLPRPAILAAATAESAR
eukprot:10190953-Alexandrium_andersonii.AAC.1